MSQSAGSGLANIASVTGRKSVSCAAICAAAVVAKTPRTAAAMQDKALIMIASPSYFADGWISVMPYSMARLASHASGEEHASDTRRAPLGPAPGGAGNGRSRVRAGREACRSAKGRFVNAVYELRRKRPAASDTGVRKEIRHQGQRLACRVRESAATDSRRSGGQAPRGRCDPLLRARDGDAASGKNPATRQLALLGGADRGRAAAPWRMGRDLPVRLGAGLQPPSPQKRGLARDFSGSARSEVEG